MTDEDLIDIMQRIQELERKQEKLMEMQNDMLNIIAQNSYHCWGDLSIIRDSVNVIVDFVEEFSILLNSLTDVKDKNADKNKGEVDDYGEPV